MSKRKDGTQIIDVPQPTWPELAYFDGGEMHRIVPIVAFDGSATYDISKMDAKAATVVDELVTQKVKDDPTKVIRVLKAGDVVIDEVIL